ncbi:uncharacterized protein LOC141665716 [Apium graveolens]|uniref:uncharacterized protein LOC141665716 n=1 Tax=Apium graveolens TaxID=4045 RepID=UPI003D7ABBA7
MADMCDEISTLDTTRTSWKIKVRVTRMWPSNASATEMQRETLKGYNLIFLDEDNCHVHVFVYADQWKAIKDKVEDGALYVITNFHTKEAKENLKPVSTKILINFSHSTTVERVLEDDFVIPRHKFKFVDLGDLLSSGEVSTLPSSKVFLDLDNIFVIAMHHSSYVNIKKYYTKLQSKYMILVLVWKLFFSTVKVQSIEETDWWYSGCIDCEGEVEKSGTIFKCTLCPKVMLDPEKRYKIVILGEDSTEVLNFILMDRAVKRLMGMTVTKMIASLNHRPSNQTFNVLIINESVKYYFSQKY